MIYNGRDFSEFGVHVDESKAFGSPEKDYELIEVVGRNGNLSIYNDRFKDIVLSFPCFIRSGFIEKYRNLLAYLNSLNGYQRLETEKEPNHFRKALFTGSVEVQTTPWNQGGFFTINFTCLPQRFLKSGETSVEVTTTLENPTLFPSKPIIRVHGNGTLNINDIYITVASSPYEYVDIDCELMDCYYGSNNANQYVSFSTTDFVTLQSGTNSFVIDGFTSVEVTPRWYEV